MTDADLPPEPPTAAEREAALDALAGRVRDTHDAVGDAFPYVCEPATGEWTTTSDGNWCGGHWVDLLRIAADRTDGPAGERLREAAREHAAVVAAELRADSMFRGMNLRYAGFRAYDATGDRTAFARGLSGADAMVAEYRDAARQIPLGMLAVRGPEQFRGPESEAGPPGDRIGAVDNVYTALGVLWDAFDRTGEPAYRDVAVSHADRHLDWYVREDGRTYHHAVFDPETGTLERQYNELARSDDTCWARGQGWCIAGLALAYRATGAERYLGALELTTRYYREHSPPDLVPRWDHEVTDPDEPRDASAAALVAYGLARLSTPARPAGPPLGNDHVDRVAALRTVGERVLGSLVREYQATDPDGPCRGGILHGCFNRPGEYADDHELVWTDYYVARTLADLAGE